jgi:hypothetical protein
LHIYAVWEKGSSENCAPPDVPAIARSPAGFD